MRVLVCPTAFKESLTAGQVTDAVAEGVRRGLPSAAIRAMPVSDGGPGLLDSILAAESGEIRMSRVSGPLGSPVEARSLWVSPSTVVIETADACGLHLVPSASRDPMRADTRGVGELVAACLEQGATEIAMGLGGSATVDGGTGLARIFGYRFLDLDGADLPSGGGGLATLARVAPGPPLAAGVVVTAIADVRAPLAGPDGAARRFGPQKGASSRQVETLEAGLVRLADRLREDLGRDVADLPGAGASGGLGAGCAAFVGAYLVTGSDWVLDRLDFERALAGADLVVTGEGAWDATSSMGKITGEILRRSRLADVPALLVCGRASGPAPPGVGVVGGSGAWLGPRDLTRLVAEAVG
ncbi:MAG: glycerate kinase [Gemmatimonadetes bacterium]|nr:glycerate kinase [Gemmatimonadota bacterium]MBT8478377.1 glycerate kinase [Gemmatimonadota bacterium]NNK48705.1 glycerate kinase [Gemmatimonadota bacterium]